MYDFSNELNRSRFSSIYACLNQRQFKRHKDYIDYNLIIRYVSAYLSAIKSHVYCIEMFEDMLQDKNFALAIHSCWCVYKDPLLPVYAIKPNLLDLFKNTDIPTGEVELKKIFRNAIFVLPNNYLIDPDGDQIRWLQVTHFFDNTQNDLYNNDYADFLKQFFNIRPSLKITFDSGSLNSCEKDESTIRWLTLLDNNIASYSCFAINKTSRKLNFGADKKNQRYDIANFNRKVSELLIQLMLYLQLPKNSQEDDIIDKQKISIVNMSEKIRSANDYIWLGTEIPEKNHNNIIGTHASPSTHWRRGHWRNCRVGSGRQEKKLTWILPTLVNEQAII